MRKYQPGADVDNEIIKPLVRVRLYDRALSIFGPDQGAIILEVQPPETAAWNVDRVFARPDFFLAWRCVYEGIDEAQRDDPCRGGLEYSLGRHDVAEWKRASPLNQPGNRLLHTLRNSLSELLGDQPRKLGGEQFGETNVKERF